MATCSTKKRRKGDVKSYSNEETTENIHITTRELKKEDEMNYKKQKEKPMELQGEFKKLRPPMFDGEYEEATEGWLLNIKQYFQVYRYVDNLREHLSIFKFFSNSTLDCVYCLHFYPPSTTYNLSLSTEK